MFTLKTCYKTSTLFIWALVVLNAIYCMYTIFTYYNVYANIDSSVAASALFGYLHLSRLGILCYMSFCVSGVLLSSLVLSKVLSKKSLRISLLTNSLPLVTLIITNQAYKFCDSVEKSIGTVLGIPLTVLCVLCSTYCIFCSVRNKEC